MSNAPSRSLAMMSLPGEGTARRLVQFGLVLGGSILLALSARAKVELGPVDLSMQSLVIMLLATAFGLRLGVATVLLYLAQGAAGLPVFQGTPENGIGLPYMLGPTGGYLLGFVALAAIMGWAADRGWDRSPLKLALAGTAGTVALFGLGYIWLAALIGPAGAWTYGVAPFMVASVVKLGIAAVGPAALWSALGRR
jgi:biotin transport system substrate-specific component